MATNGSSGYTVRQMTVGEAAEEIDAIVAAEAERRGGPMPPLVIGPDDGTARERFRADMARAQAAGIAWPGAEDVTATVKRVTRAGDG